MPLSLCLRSWPRRTRLAMLKGIVKDDDSASRVSLPCMLSGKERQGPSAHDPLRSALSWHGSRPAKDRLDAAARLPDGVVTSQAGSRWTPPRRTAGTGRPSAGCIRCEFAATTNRSLGRPDEALLWARVLALLYHLGRPTLRDLPSGLCTRCDLVEERAAHIVRTATIAGVDLRKIATFEPIGRITLGTRLTTSARR